jgi:hypothetical protein
MLIKHSHGLEDYNIMSNKTDIFNFTEYKISQKSPWINESSI